MIHSLRNQVIRLSQHPAAEYVLLALITLLALAMRLFKLGDWSVWIDEVYTWQRASSVFQDLASLPPPSTIAIGTLLQFVPPTEWNLRIIPALIGVITLPILYFPTRKLFGPGVALLSMLFLALSPWHLLWSQNARFYTSLALFYTLAIFYFYFAVEESRVSYLILSAVFLAVAFLERKMALFYIPIAVLYLVIMIWIGGVKPARIRQMVASIALPVVVVGAYEFYNVVLAHHSTTISRFIDLFIGYRQNPVRLLLSVVVDVGLPLFLLAIAGGIFLILQRRWVGLYLLIGALLPMVALVIMSPFTQTFSRYMFQSLPTWAILGAVGAKELWTRTAKDGRVLSLAVLVLLIADPLSQGVLYYEYQHGNRQDFRAAYNVIQEQMQPGDQVVATWREVGEYHLAWKYEKPDYGVIWTQDLRPKDVIDSGRRTWFVIDNRTGFISPKLESWLQTEQRLVSVNDVYLPGKLLAMRVFLYDPAAQ